MSKCEISLRFNREDRTYAGGELVTGRAVIRVNEDVTCKGITLTHQWKTHGRGNTATGPKETIELAPAGPLSAGETLDLPFSLTAATHPLTYHGNLINVDHYLSVEVNVPWAFNPKVQEEYILRAGAPPAEFSGTRGAVIFLAAKSQKLGPVGTVMVLALLAMFLIMLSIFALFLLPIILIVAGFFWMRRRALASRLGEVQLTMPHVVVAPGEDWPLRIQFHPRKQFRFNGIFLTLIGKEAATSGSGTKSTTHTHKVLEHKVEIRSADMLEADVAVDESFSLVFPDTSAYSLEAPDNKIDWTAEVRIDIPRFPDWKKTQTLQVVPVEFIQNLSATAATAPDADDVAAGSPVLNQWEAPGLREAAAPDPATPLPLPAMNRAESLPAVNRAETQDDTDDRDVPVPAERNVPQDLLELAAQIAAVSRHGHARTDIMASVLGETFDATIVVDRVNSSLGVTTSHPGYEYGKTIIGTIEGTEQSIQVMTPKSLNDDVDDLRRGDTWPLQICIEGWDSLFSRINARQLDESGS